MKRILILAGLILVFYSCGRNDKTGPDRKAAERALAASIPVDKGFSRYIASYTSGTVLSTASIEVQFTPEFAEMADKSARALFEFNPVIIGKTEWKDDYTIVFTPAKALDARKIYTGKLHLSALAAVEDRLADFPLWIQTQRKNIRVVLGAPEALPDGTGYNIKGQISANDEIDNKQVEKIIILKYEGQDPPVKWEHNGLIHTFTVSDIRRSGDEQQLILEWDGSAAGIRQSGSSSVRIPATGDFSVIEILSETSGTQRIDIVFSDPVDLSQDLTGLVHLSQGVEADLSASGNVISVFPKSSDLTDIVELKVEPSVKNAEGKTLDKVYSRQLDFSKKLPQVAFEGEGVILPSSKNLVFPFRAANLKSVDLRIVKIYENNLPYFLQENDISNRYGMKRFGIPVYTGKIDLATPGMQPDKMNLYTIDLSDYIDVEPGVLYNVTLKFRKSYSLYNCQDSTEISPYEQLLMISDEKLSEAWNNPGVYYEDPEDEIYWSYGFNWDEREDPCKDAYYSPDRKQSRNILASNLGIIAKKGDDNTLHVIVNDLLTALPVNEANVDVFDYQLQKMVSGTTSTEGSVNLNCSRPPFLVIVSKDKDRNYLKTNEGASLSLSSFDVAGTRPEKGIKAFIYGERDVWRPGDSIFLSVLIKNMKGDLPSDHPVQFELINPLEQKVDNQVMITGGKNLLVFKTSTPRDAVTGDYRAVLRIGGATFTKRVRVETIKPNRLKIDLNFNDEILGGSKATSEGSLKIKWLNGAMARNLNASVEYILRTAKTEFTGFPQFTFDDPVKKTESQTESLFDGQTDDEGNRTIVFDPPDEIDAPGMMNAVFTVKAMEPGGDESITQKSYRYAPYKIFAGINIPGLEKEQRMLYTDRENEVRFVTVDESGKPVDSELEIKVYKLSNRWWWESDREDLGYYISNEYYEPVITRSLRTVKGSASFKFNISKDDWGRYLIRATAPSGHSTGRVVLIDWPWDYGMKGKSDGATLVAVSTDKPKYKPGDEVTLSFPSPENSRAIITLENSTGVIDEIRTATGKGNTTIKFRARPEMAPNVYAYVTIIQPHAQTVNDMPVRLYGIVPVMVEDPDTRLEPVIRMADELRSVKPFVISVNEKNGKSMTYTVAIVDEGLLDITGYKTPDPWNYFYAREALGVQTWDLYDNVLGAFGGTLERIFAVGGDEMLQDKAANKAQRFIPVVKFLGPFRLEAGKTNSHAVSLPQYTGSVRTMVIAGNDKAFGFSEKSVPVKDPLMVLVTAPRVISPGEKVTLPVTLFVQKDGIREVKISAAGENVRFEQSTVTVNIPDQGETTAQLSFTAGSKTGIAKISVNASGGGESAAYQLELDIRNPNPPETRTELKIINKNEQWNTSFGLFGTEGTNTAFIEISSIPSINLEKKLDFLMNYPHGCSEQTTSAVFPQLYLKNVRNNDPAVASVIARNVRHGIGVIASRQMTNGGIAMWPGSYQPDNWITSYSGHFMIEAEKNGYSVPAGFITKWIKFQTRVAREWQEDTKYIYTKNDQAYRLFTLALAGEPERGAMNRLRESKSLPQLSRWLLSAAYALSGRPEAAQDLLDVRNTSTETEYQGYFYGSEMRDKSIILYTLSILKNEEQALPLLKEIADKFNNAEWYSTQDASWALLSYMKFMELMSSGKSSGGKISYTINGERSDLTVSKDKIAKAELRLKPGDNTLSVENSADAPVYASLIRKGIPMSEDATAEQEGLGMKVSYYDLKMNEVDPSSIRQGTDFMMVVRITNTTFRNVDNLALSQMMPSGWEIRNTRLFEADYGIKEDSYTYRDFMDDRVNTYFSLEGKQTRTYVAIVTAAYQGEYFQPSVWCESMYTPGMYARVPGKKVKVTKPEFE